MHTGNNLTEFSFLDELSLCSKYVVQGAVNENVPTKQSIMYTAKNGQLMQ